MLYRARHPQSPPPASRRDRQPRQGCVSGAAGLSSSVTRRSSASRESPGTSSFRRLGNVPEAAVKTTKLKIPRIPIPPHTRARKNPKSGIYHPNTGKSKTLEPDRRLRLTSGVTGRVTRRIVRARHNRNTRSRATRTAPIPPPTARPVGVCRNAPPPRHAPPPHRGRFRRFRGPIP